MLKVYLAIAFILFSAVLGFTAPLAGSLISNQAAATYTDAAGVTFNLNSNRVNLIVQPLEALQLTQNQALLRPPGSPFTLVHQLANTGNVATTYSLTFSNLSGDDYDLANLHLYSDVNGNGVLDPGEPEIPYGGTILLDPGHLAGIIITGNLPANVTAGQIGRLIITAASTLQGATAFNTDSFTTTNGVVLNINKTASNLNPNPNEEVTFTINVSNVSNTQAQGVSVNVDGLPQTLALIKDAIPVNCSFVSLNVSASGIKLYHKYTDPPNTYVTSPPSNLSEVDYVAYGLNNLPVNYSVAVSLIVKVNSNASGTSTNTAQAFYFDPVTQTAESVDSNIVTLNIPGQANAINYFTNATFTRITEVTSLGLPLFVQINAAGFNKNPQVVETILVTIVSKLTGDRERYTAIESGPNDGIFRILPVVPTQDANFNPVNPGDGIIQTLPNDTLAASFVGYNTVLESVNILVDPFGVVFDSHTNAPIAGANVTLIDVTGLGNGGHPGDPAIVFLADGATPAPSTIITGVNGSYIFPRVAPSTYLLRIAPPNGYNYPSTLPIGLLPPGRMIDPAASYGGNFIITDAAGVVKIDVPLDGPPPSGLFIEKTVDRGIAEIADAVHYSVKIKNASTLPLTQLVLNDTLPFGFKYESNSAYLNDNKISDPVGSPGPGLSFNIGNMAVNQELTLSYRVRITPGASMGDNYNSAQANAASVFGRLNSNNSRALVKIQAGVFSDKGIVIGKIFIDLNKNGIQDKDEFGIPGVRIYLEDGTYAITDSEGKYNLYGLIARTHVLRVDTTTMPPGSTLVPISNRHAGEGTSCFVDLKKGELHKTDFAISSPTPEVLENIKARRAKGEIVTAEIEKNLKTRLNPDGSPLQSGDVKSLPSSGVIGEDGKVPSFDNLLAENQLNHDNSNLPALPVAKLQQTSLQSLGENITNELGFVDLKDKDTLAAPQINVRVKGMKGGKFKLLVNGKEVGADRIGSKSSINDKNVEIWEFIGIDLKAGENQLEVQQFDPFGNQRGTQSITIIAPGNMGKISLDVPKERHPADGKTPLSIKVTISDDRGVPVTSRIPVTLECDNCLFTAKDLNPVEPGVQVFIENGEATYQLLPPLEPGETQVKVSSGEFSAQEVVNFVPELRPLIMVGVLEGSVHIQEFKPGNIAPTGSRDIFEENPDYLSPADSGKSSIGNIRGGLFIKGEVLKDYLLTLGYDSQKGKDMRLFRDIQPEEYYPVYGDSSVKGFDAQSTSPLYVRIDKDKSFLLYGDFLTSNPGSSLSLGTFSRSLTGAKQHFESDNLKVNLFASRSTQKQVIQEIPADGTSGPYLLKSNSIVVNSEKVEILVRDRNQPAIILTTELKNRFSDYTVEYNTGRILFKQPIPSVDPNLNPVSIRITFEMEQGGQKFWISGADASLKLNKYIQVGGNWVKDNNPQDSMELNSANIGIKLGEHTSLAAETAMINQEATGIGKASYAQLIHEDKRLKARLYTGRTDPNFNNPSASMTPGRSESGVKGSYKIDGKTRLVGEAIQTKDLINNGNREGYQAYLERTLFNNVRMEFGVRHANETAAAAQPTSLGATPINFTSARAKVSAQLPKHPEATIYTEYEQNLKDANQQVFSVGGEYQVANRTRIYARHDFTSSLSGRYALNNVQSQNTTVFGIDTNYLKDNRIFSEYRARDAFSGREAEAAIGLRNQWNVARGLKLNTGLERVQNLNGAGAMESTAVTGAVEYTANPLCKGTASLELSDNAGCSSLLSTVGVAYKLSKDLTFLGKNIVNLVKNKDSFAGNKIQERLLVGFAFRQTDKDTWNGLLKYELKYEKNDNAPSNACKVHIVSANINCQPAKKLVLSANVAGKMVSNTQVVDVSNYSAYQVGARILYDINSKWDVGLIGSKLFSPGSSNKSALGFELGHLLFENFWLSAGYNVQGYSDLDLINENYTDKGFFLKFRVKLGEGLLKKEKE